MEIFNEKMERIESPDLSCGFCTESEKIVHHDAVTGVDPVRELRLKKIYPNGSREMEEVILVPGVEAAEAYDEKIPILIYHKRTEEEQKKYLENLNKPTDRERIEELEAALAAQKRKNLENEAAMMELAEMLASQQEVMGLV